MSDRKSYKENYAILEDIANRMQNQETPDIDELVPMIEKATKAYEACKDRLAEVEKIIAQRFEDDSKAPESPPRRESRSS